MSVKVVDRGAQTLEVLTHCRKLVLYTIGICSNEKLFAKRKRWVLTARIISEAEDAFVYIARANSIYVCTKEDYLLRRENQYKAKEHLFALQGLIDIAYNLLGTLGSRRIEYWSKVTDTTITKLNNWIASDYKRHQKLLE